MQYSVGHGKRAGGARNTSRKNLTGGDDEAEEDQGAGKPQPEPLCLETFTDSLQLMVRVTHSLSPAHDSVLHIRRVLKPCNLCGEQERREGSGQTGQAVHVAPLLPGGAQHSPDLITAFSIMLQHGHNYCRIFHYPVCN